MSERQIEGRAPAMSRRTCPIFSPSNQTKKNRLRKNSPLEKSHLRPTPLLSINILRLSKVPSNLGAAPLVLLQGIG
jgi:hypothetical protein